MLLCLQKNVVGWQATAVLLRHRIEQVESLIVKLNRYVLGEGDDEPQKAVCPNIRVAVW